MEAATCLAVLAMGKVLQGMLQISSSSMVLLSQATENYLSVLIWNISMEKMGLWPLRVVTIRKTSTTKTCCDPRKWFCVVVFFSFYCFSCWNHICILLCKRAVGQLWTTTPALWGRLLWSQSSHPHSTAKWCSTSPLAVKSALCTSAMQYRNSAQMYGKLQKL